MITGAVHAVLSGDATLAGLLATYGGEPAVFTTDPPPGDAALPYIVTAGHAADSAFDTKVTLGRQIWRDVRCYAPADGSAVTVEAMAERVRALLHRQKLTIAGWVTAIAECTGPTAVDEEDAYGRVVTVRVVELEG